MTVYDTGSRLDCMMAEITAAQSGSELDWLEAAARAEFAYPQLAHLEEMIAGRQRVLARNLAPTGDQVACDGA